jgi:hypothetical protein
VSTEVGIELRAKSKKPRHLVSINTPSESSLGEKGGQRTVPNLNKR